MRMVCMVCMVSYAKPGTANEFPGDGFPPGIMTRVRVKRSTKPCKPCKPCSGAGRPSMSNPDTFVSMMMSRAGATLGR